MRGEALLVLLLLLVWACSYSRWFLPVQEEAPAVLPFKPTRLTVELSFASGEGGVYQLNDGHPLADVIKLTDHALPRPLEKKLALEPPPQDGELFVFQEKTGGTITFARMWMPATHRILLGIPLHPDRMSVADWEALPGIGPKLAAAIERDRQKNGDFIVYSTLQRVKGVGPKRLTQWTPYFQPLPRQK